MRIELTQCFEGSHHPIYHHPMEAGSYTVIPVYFANLDEDSSEKGH